MLSHNEIMALRECVADFVVVFTDAILERGVEDGRDVMEDFCDFMCGALEAARRDGRRQVLELTNN